MSEWSGIIYAVAAPLPTTYGRRQKERQPRPVQRSSSFSRASHRSRRPIRHTRTSSGSQSNRLSHETLSPAQTTSPAVGDDGPVDDSTPASSSDAQISTSIDTETPKSPVKPRGSSIGSPIASPRSWSVKPMPRGFRPKHTKSSSSPAPKYATMYPDSEPSKPILGQTKQVIIPITRTESISSASGASLSTRTMISMDPSTSADQSQIPKTFALRNGRTYYNDPTLTYPLPHDLTELHRQCLRTLLLIELYGAPVCSPYVQENPPQKVLEIGCGSGYWSMKAHRWFKERGHGNISFTGIDIAPLAPGSAHSPANSCKPDKDMKWKFIQYDMRQIPWPLTTEEYDLIMVKDISLATPNTVYQKFMDEYIRLLKPGGTIEMWETDSTIRMLRPHVPNPVPGSDDAKDHDTASKLGAYIISANTPLSAPLNTFLVEYNTWMSRALEARALTPVPCTIIGSNLVQESETLMEVKSKRMAIPFSEVRWEREGVGGVVTKDGKTYVDVKGKNAPHQKVEKKTLTPGQSAVRRSALLTVVQQVQALEPILREASGKSIDEWDIWLGKMMGDLLSEGGTSWGECLEVGVWWSRKKL